MYFRWLLAPKATNKLTILKIKIFRNLIGFDPRKLCNECHEILTMPNLTLYIYNNDILRLSKQYKAWLNFYELWIEKQEKWPTEFLTVYAENPKDPFKEILQTSSDYLTKHLEVCTQINKQWHIKKILFEAVSETKK